MNSAIVRDDHAKEDASFVGKGVDGGQVGDFSLDGGLEEVKEEEFLARRESESEESQNECLDELLASFELEEDEPSEVGWVGLEEVEEASVAVHERSRFPVWRFTALSGLADVF